MGFKDNAEIRQLSNNETVIFSDIVKKTNKRFKVQDRVLLLTNLAIYNLEKFPKPKKNLNYELKRRITLDLVSAISVSKLQDNVSCK